MGRERIDTDVCVVGGGPAGATVAARLAQLGHDVCLLERAAFPRRRLGESLTPGVLPMLEVVGARAAVEAAGFPAVGAVDVRWGEAPPSRDGAANGRSLLVDRGRFDALLLARAVASGVRVLQPAGVHSRRREEGGWRLEAGASGGRLEVRAAFVVDATGRGGRAGRAVEGPRTVALYRYWRGEGLPVRPRIEAASSAWLWGVPLPDGTTNTLAFLDAEEFRSSVAPPDVLLRELLARTDLLADCRDLRPVTPVGVTDATPYLHATPVTIASLRVGDAAVAVDPISSSGVQKAVQSALAGAVVVNTLLRRPADADSAMRYYRDRLRHAYERHQRWAEGHYAAAGRADASPFWRDRANEAAPRASPSPSGGTVDRLRDGRCVRVSPRLRLLPLPCLDEAFVVVREGIDHPSLEEPLAYLAGWEVAPLLRAVPPSTTPLELARRWSTRMPMPSAVALVGWLLEREILETTEDAPVDRPAVAEAVP